MKIEQEPCYKPVTITFETRTEFTAFTNIIDHADDDADDYPLSEDAKALLIKISNWITEEFGLSD